MKIIKIISAILFLFITQQAYSKQLDDSTKFVLNGELTQHADSLIMIYNDMNGEEVVIQKAIEGNKFIVSGDIAEPTSAFMFFKNKGEIMPRNLPSSRVCTFYIEPKKMSVHIDPLSVYNAQFSGSISQEEFEPLNKLITPINVEMDKFFVTSGENDRKEGDEKKNVAPFMERIRIFREEIKNVSVPFFLAHPNSYVTAYRASDYTLHLPLDTLKLIYDKFNEKVKQSSGGKELDAMIKKLEVGLPGSIATDFTKTDVNGKSLSLSDFKGKYVIIDFWASWCIPCRKSNPHLLETYKKYHPLGLEIIGVADDDTQLKAWKLAIDNDKIGIWHHVLRGANKNGQDNAGLNVVDLDQPYNIGSIPTKILVDPSGKIIGRYGDASGGTEEDLDAMLAKIYKN